jgi:hypothetical protein
VRFWLALSHEEQKSTAIRKKLRPAMTTLSGGKFGNGSNGAAVGADAHQRVDDRRREYDYAIGIPGSPARLRCVGKHLHRASSQVDSLQLAVSKKPERTTVWRPKRGAGAFGASEWLRPDLIERPEPKL